MKTTVSATKFAVLAACLLAAVPASAQSLTWVIYTGTTDRVEAPVDTSLSRQAEIAVEAACDKPFLRDLKGQRLYAACIAEARAQVDAQVAERAATHSLASAAR